MRDSEPATPDDGLDEVGVLVRGLRVYALIWAAAISIALPVAATHQDLLHLPLAAILAVGGFSLAINILVARLPWARILPHRHGRVALEAYPIVAAALGAGMALLAPWSAIYGVVLIAAGAVGALYSRRAVVWALLVVPPLTLGIVWMRDGEPNPLVLFFLATAAVSITWMTHTTGTAYRDALHGREGEVSRTSEMADRLATLAQSRIRMSSVERGHVMQAVTDAIPLLGWKFGGIWLDSGKGRWTLTTQSGVPSELANIVSTSPIWQATMHMGTTTIIDDYAREPGFDPTWAPHVHSLLGVPVHLHGAIIGMLVVARHQDRPALEDDVKILQLLGDLADRAIDVAAEFEEREIEIIEIERVTRLKQDFLGTVSHELRTPLAVVLGMAETIDVHWTELSEDQRRRMASRMHVHAASLERIIEALLDYSRLDAGKVEINRQPVALFELAQSVVDRLAETAEDHQIRLRCATASRETRALCDPLLIERVLENLINNACRHTPAGCSVQVDVSDDGMFATVGVSDDGPGIAPQDVVQLGERFFRGTKTSSRSSRGLGLGLAFCAQILHMHGSRLEIHSEVGEGSTFSFTLQHANIGSTN